MTTTILLVIVLSISFSLVMFRLYSISILLGAISIFIIGSLILFQEGHVLIGSIFLIVYSGAILVFICISLLISPAIRPKFKYEHGLKSENIKYKYLMILVFGLIYTIIFFNYLYFYNTELLYSFSFNDNLIQLEINNFYIPEISNFGIIEISKAPIIMDNNEILTFCEYSMKNIIHYENINVINPTNLLFDLPSFNFNNQISFMYQDDIFLVFMVGIYLFIVLLCCLVLFSINHEKRVIKRQDSVDQILKRWF